MQTQHKRSLLLYLAPAGIVFVVLAGGLAYEFRQIAALQTEVGSLGNALSTTNQILAANTNQLSQKVTDLSTQTTGISSTLSTTQQNIDAVKNQVGGVEQTVGTISGTVGNLQKLAAVDPEILKKYSKIYFTNENYVPAHLASVPTEYVYSTTRKEQFLTEASPYLISLLYSAKSNGVNLYVKSAYRSFAEQKSLKTKYSITYGAGTANSFSADQGYSEHQLGTALDFISSGQNGQLDGFDKTATYSWLLANGYRFGFILSYPKGNSYYVYEPWHWRFVGIKLATYLHDNNLHFYDMDQRDIDQYLVDTFD
jgi:LAS superfamily LD-carboxypeptidase LdcB